MISIFRDWEGSYEVFENDIAKEKDNLDDVVFNDGEEFHIILIPVKEDYND